MARYLEDMGVPAAFLETSAAKPGDELLLLNEQQLRELKVVTGGENLTQWGVEVHPDGMWVRGERDSLFGHGKVLLVYSKANGFSFAALVETMGRQDELLTFGLVEIMINGEESRIDISDRCMRAPAGIYTYFMTQLSQEEAQTLANSESLGIYIRASADAQIFLGISAISTEGGQDTLKGLYSIGST